MRITVTEEYGLRCLIHVARAWAEKKTVSLREVAAKEGLSLENATKLMTKLRRAQLVKSIRGVNGGFSLSRPPEAITLAQAVFALDGALGPSQKDCDKLCDRFKGIRDACANLKDCSVRPMWITLSLYIFGAMSRISLKQLLENEAASAQYVKNAFKEYVQSM